MTTDAPDGVEAPSIHMPVVKYSPDDAAIAVLRKECAELLADPAAAVATDEGYERVRSALQITRKWRGEIERNRVSLKADALEFGRLVDLRAKEALAKVTSIEDPLKAAKDAKDDEKKKAKEAAEKAEREALEAAERAKVEAEVARLKAIRDAEQAKLDADRAALAAERAAMLAEQKAADDRRRAEQDAADARRKAEQDERDRAAAIEAARVAAVNAEAARILKESSDKLEAERAALKAEADRQAKAEADRLEAIRAAKEKEDRAEFERQTKERLAKEAEMTAARLAKEAADKAEAERLRAEAAAKAKAEADMREQARLLAAAPDVEKLNKFGEMLLEFLDDNKPKLKTADAKGIFEVQFKIITDSAIAFQNYRVEKKK
jgi:hypothetical protein